MSTQSILSDTSSGRMSNVHAKYGCYVWHRIDYLQSLRFTTEGEIYLFTQFLNNKLHTQNDLTLSDSMQRIHLKFVT